MLVTISNDRDGLRGALGAGGEAFQDAGITSD